MGYLGAMRAGALAVVLSVLPMTAHAESLKKAFENAYENNPNIMSALLNVKATAEGIALAKSAKLPSISATATAGVGFIAPAGGEFVASHSYGLDFSYNQTLFDNFKTEAQIEQARALTEVSKYALQNAEQNVLLSVAQAYYAVIRDTQLVQLLASNMTFFDAQVNSSEDRLRLGEGTKIDVSQSKARQAAAVAAYRAGIASLQTSQASFERWVGHKPSGLIYDYNFGKALPTSIDNAIGSAQDRHPALLSARASIRVAQSGSDAASAAFGPTLNLIGSLCAIGCINGAPDAGGISGSAGLSLSIPIYSGGALGASLRKANIQQIQSEVDALSARDQIREAVISAWATLQNAAAQIISAQSGVDFEPVGRQRHHPGARCRAGDHPRRAQRPGRSHHGAAATDHCTGHQDDRLVRAALGRRQAVARRAGPQCAGAFR